ncbi:MAG: ribonuclease P protein component [Planctomycetes bacterium]|nr:ribonuclease P protein component [Planctomycetota bacterium]MCB9905314.1 ribonuclease P protein component [Planctomycetota bacterium]
MRISSPLDFARAFRRGSRARGSTLVVVVHENGLDHARLGLSIGKVVWKSAVKRNRVRRIFREAFRLEYAQLPAGHDLVLIAAEKRLEPTLEETRLELVKLARKAQRRLAERRAQEAECGDEGAA